MRQSTVAMATVVLDLQLGDVSATESPQLVDVSTTESPQLQVEGLDLQLVTIYAGHDARMRPLAGRAAHRAELYRGSPGAPASARE